MITEFKLIPRHLLDITAWDTCVATSPQRILYGYTWYLDAVLPAPDWKWVGVVMLDAHGSYRAVMPIPLRRKRIGGITYAWRVHQPFFCQILGVFSRDLTIDPSHFYQIIYQRFRYGSVLHLNQHPATQFDTCRLCSTQVLDLSIGYASIYQYYRPDCRRNLRRALAANWTVIDSLDVMPLIQLFRDNHADRIEGGVGEWAYAILQDLFAALIQRRHCTLRYAIRDGQIEAGALFAHEGNRVIYLFNAASDAGRQGHARTLLIDQILQEHAGQSVIFDFESPEQASIRAFYAEFGAVCQPFWSVHWSRLTWLERTLQTVLHSR